MAFKLTTAEIKLRDELHLDLIKAWEAIDAAVKEFNHAQRMAKAKVEDAVIMFNKIAENAKAFTDAVAEHASDEISSKSESWQEGERGENASAWKDEWESFDLEELDPDWPGEISIDKPFIDLTALPEEA